MADAFLTALGGPLPVTATGTPSFTSLALDAAGDKVGWIVQAVTAEQITHIGFRYGARTGTPPTYKIGFQGVDASGHPDGTYLGGASPASGTFTPPADATWNSTWQWVALTNAYTPARGDRLAIVIEHSAGTIDGTNNSTFTYGTSGIQASDRVGFPHAETNTAAWAKVNSLLPVYGFKGATTVFGKPLVSVSSDAISTDGHRVAREFSLPSGWGSTYKVIGVRAVVMTIGLGETNRFGLWNAGGLVQGVDVNSDIFSANGSTFRTVEIYFDEATLTALDFGTTYYLGMERTAGASTVTLNCLELGASADRAAWGFGANANLATYDGATWTQTLTKLPLLEPILADITEPAGGGGGVMVTPGWSGGFSG